MSGNDGSSLLGLVAKRTEPIECLMNGITEKRGIEAELDVSRQTVGRALSELENAGLVNHVGDDYELTLYGKLAYQEHHQRRTRYETLATAKAFLAPLSIKAPIPFHILDGADIQLTDFHYRSMRSPVLNPRFVLVRK